MKIIKRGRSPGNKSFQMTCPYCVCVFELTLEEMTFHSDMRDGDYYSVKCPELSCGKTVNLNALLARYRALNLAEETK